MGLRNRTLCGAHIACVHLCECVHVEKYTEGCVSLVLGVYVLLLLQLQYNITAGKL